MWGMHTPLERFKCAVVYLIRSRRTRLVVDFIEEEGSRKDSLFIEEDYPNEVPALSRKATSYEREPTRKISC